MREATQRQVNRIVAAREEHDRTRPTDTREALRRGAERIWDTIETNSELLRVMYREPEAIEGFSGELWSAVTASAYDRMGTALSGATTAGASQVEDPEASAALLVASISLLPDRADADRTDTRQDQRRQISRSLAQARRKRVHRQTTGLTFR